MECSHCGVLFPTTDFYDHMRDITNSHRMAIDSELVCNGDGNVVGGRITEEFTLCYDEEDGETEE
jgi:hypothetical protein